MKSDRTRQALVWIPMALAGVALCVALKAGADGARKGPVLVASAALEVPAATAASEPATLAPSDTSETVPASVAPDATSRPPGETSNRVVDGPPTLASDPLPTDKSKRPGKHEWAKAQTIRLDRSTRDGCTAQRIREWVRLTCTDWSVESITLVAGTRDGVQIWIGEAAEFKSRGVIEMPVRKGDRRVFQLQQRAGKYGRMPYAIVSESWIDGDDAPTMSVIAAD